MSELWNHETELSKLGIDPPKWITQSIDTSQLAAIIQGGCASGAYMPAVTYYDAAQTMAEHGDDVLQFIEDQHGELPAIPSNSSWGGIAVFFLSMAVEMWASSVEAEAEDALAKRE